MYSVLENEWNIDEILAQNTYVILQIGTETCMPCHALTKRLKEWGKDYPQVCIIYISMETYVKETAQMNIMSVPTILTYIEGKLFQRESGYFSLNQILARFEKFIGE